jgi:hypothetical protein
MWLSLYCFVLLLAWYHSFFWSPLHLYVLASFIYLLYYLLGTGRNGSRQWRRLRSLSVWDQLRRRGYFSHHLHSAHWSQFNTHGHAYLFVIHQRAGGGGDENDDEGGQWATFSAFAAHGKCNTLISSLSPLVAMPRLLLCLPYITDILQWFGCCQFTDDELIDAIHHNISIVVPCASKQALCEWAASRSSPTTTLHLVPVVHTGESHLYWSRKLSSCSQVRAGVRWPVIALGLWGSCLPKQNVELHTYIGEPIAVNQLSSDSHSLLTRFESAMTQVLQTANAHDTDFDIEKGEK